MEVLNQPSFDAPIPGMSLTHELGARPWQSAPQFATVDEVADYYMERMSGEDFMLQLIDVLEMGIPVAVLANTIQLASVMEGVHTIDTGMLVLPMIMEMIMMLGDSAGVKYDSGLEGSGKPKARDTLLAKVVANYEKELETVDLSDNRDVDLTEEEDTPEEPRGLMARRTQ